MDPVMNSQRTFLDAQAGGNSLPSDLSHGFGSFNGLDHQLRRSNSGMSSALHDYEPYARLQRHNSNPLVGSSPMMLQRSRSEMLSPDMLFSNQSFGESSFSKQQRKKTTGPLHNSKYKAKLCKNWVQKGMCPYYEKCQFAHGEHEIEKWAMKRGSMRVKRQVDTPIMGFQPSDREQTSKVELYEMLNIMQRRNGGTLNSDDVARIMSMLNPDQQKEHLRRMPQGFRDQFEQSNPAYDNSGLSLNISHLDDISLGYPTGTTAPSSSSTMNTFDFLDSHEHQYSSGVDEQKVMSSSYASKELYLGSTPENKATELDFTSEFAKLGFN